MTDEIEHDPDLLADAKRYRWLRHEIKFGDFGIVKISWCCGAESWGGDDPDRAIDDLIKARDQS